LPYAADPYAAASAPARRAGVLMIVMGALTLAFGMCSGIGLVLPEELVKQQLEIMPATPDRPMTIDSLRRQSLISLILLVGAGIPMIVIGVFVRRAGKAALITGIVIASLAILFLGLSAISALALATRSPVMVLSACVTAIPLALFILLLVWLIQAVRGASGLQQMQSAYQQQYWQYQQQQQAYGLPGQGFPPQPPPPPQDQRRSDSHDRPGSTS
jgi:hypothetical protein